MNAVKQTPCDNEQVMSVFYCPLKGVVVDSEGLYSDVGDRYLDYFKYIIAEVLELDRSGDEADMAEYFDEDDSVKKKFVSAEWGVESYHGRLFGRIKCRLTKELNDMETEILKDWITGQNSDGFGEHFEQQPIRIEDGDLYVAFWNSGEGYAIMTRNELDEYIDNQNWSMGGM